MHQSRVDEGAIKPEVPQRQLQGLQTATITSGRRPLVSERKLKSNRENAIKSTGAADTEGKGAKRPGSSRAAPASSQGRIGAPDCQCSSNVRIRRGIGGLAIILIRLTFKETRLCLPPPGKNS